MNNIQNHPCVGEKLSVARAREGIDSNLLFCSACHDRIEFANVGAWTATRIKLIRSHNESAICYLCECEIFRVAYQVGRVS